MTAKNLENLSAVIKEKTLLGAGVSGFTLIEILIALVILSFISLFTAQSIRTAIQTRTKMQADLDQQAQLKNALAIMERDIGMAFNYRDYITEMLRQLKAGNQTTPVQPIPGAPPVGGFPPGSGLPPGAPPGTPGAPGSGGISGNQELDEAASRPDLKLTNFIGDSDQIQLSTLSNVRMRTDAKESDQMSVEYKLGACPSNKLENKNPKKREAVGRCLKRRVWPYLDKDFKTGGQELTLLENVEDFQLRYLGFEKEGWQKSWMSNERGDSATQGHFPQAVEVTLTTNWNKRKFTLQTVAMVRFPNNPPKSLAAGAGTASGAPGAAGGPGGGPGGGSPGGP